MLATSLEQAFADAEASRPSAESVREVLDRHPAPDAGEVIMAIQATEHQSPAGIRTSVEQVNRFLDSVPEHLRTIAPVPEIAAMIGFGLDISDERRAELYRQLDDLLAADRRAHVA